MTTSPLQRTRAYAPIEGRQQADDRLVSSALELRTMLEEAANAGSELHVRLAADLELEEGVTIPAEIPAFTLNGGGIYGLLVVADLTNILTLAGEETALRLRDFTSTTNTGVTATNFLSHTDPTDHGPISATGVSVDGVTDILDPVKFWGGTRWIDCTFGDLTRLGPTSPGFLVGNLFVATTFGVLDFSGSARASKNHVIASDGQFLLGSSNLLSPNVIIGGDTWGVTEGTPDGDIRVAVGGSRNNLVPAPTRGPMFIETPNAPAALAGVNPTFFPSSSRIVRLDVGTSSGNLTLGNGSEDGAPLRLYCVNAGGGALTLPDNVVNNVRLSAAWPVLLFDTLDLMWDAADGSWIETARSNN